MWVAGTEVRAVVDSEMLEGRACVVFTALFSRSVCYSLLSCFANLKSVAIIITERASDRSDGVRAVRQS